MEGSYAAITGVNREERSPDGSVLRGAKVVLYCTSVRLAALAREALRSWTISHECRSWDDIEALIQRAVPLLAIVPHLTTEELERVVQFRRRFPAQPFVVVTDKDPDSARTLANAGIREIVWSADIHRDVSAALHSEGNSAFFDALARRIGEASQLPHLLRTVLVRAVLASPPMHSVAELSALAGRHSGTMTRAWKGEVHAGDMFRLEDFVRWMVLMRAAQRRGFEGAWHLAAIAVGVDPRTLNRIANRLAGASLKELEVRGFAYLADRCGNELGSRLLGSRGV